MCHKTSPVFTILLGCGENNFPRANKLFSRFMLKWDLVSLAPVYWTVEVLLSSLGLSLLYVIQHESLACILLYFCFIDAHSCSLIFFLLLETFVQGAATFKK